jgi:hypothetical protein
MKQTAIEWLISELMSKGIIDADEWVWNDDISILDITNQAKEMEKQQIEQAFDSGHLATWNETPEQYYNETFKNTNNG